MKRNLLAGSVAAAAAVLLVGTPTSPASALPIPAATAQSVGGEASLISDVRYRGRRYGYYRRAYYPRYGYYRRNRAGAAIAGAALGIIGGLATAAAARSYYDDPYYGYYGGYYPAYGYHPASYGYYPAYGYGYGYGYPSYYGYGWGRPVWRSGGWRW
jgi:hypothetical protein